MRQRMRIRIQNIITETSFDPEVMSVGRGVPRSGKISRQTLYKSVVSLRSVCFTLFCSLVLSSVCSAQTGTSSGLAAPVSGFPQSSFSSTSSTVGSAKTTTSPASSGSASLAAPVPQLSTPVTKPSATPAASAGSLVTTEQTPKSPQPASKPAATNPLAAPVPPKVSSGVTGTTPPAQMQMSPNIAPKQAKTNPLASPPPAKNQPARPAVSGSNGPLAVPAAVPGRGNSAPVPAKAPPVGTTKDPNLTAPRKAAAAPVAPKPKPVENPIIVAMIQKPTPGTSAIVGSPLTVNDLLTGVTNPRQRHLRLNAYWTLAQKLGTYNIRVQHANDVNACIQQHSPAPTGNILVLLRSAQLLAVQHVKEAELDFIQAQFRFANTITEGRLRLIESNYFAGVSNEAEKQILTKTLSIPSDPPTSMEYNTRLQEIAKTRGASGTAKTLGITIPLQYGIVKSRLDESTQAYENLLKLFRTPNTAQELVLVALDHTTRAKIEMFNAVIEYNRMIAAYVAETVAANVYGADLMATLNQYAPEVAPVKQVRFDATRTRETTVPPTFAPSNVKNDHQTIGPTEISSYNSVPTPSPAPGNTPSASWASSPALAPDPNRSILPAGYGSTQSVSGASLSAPGQNNSFSAPTGTTPTVPSYSATPSAPGTRLAAVEQNSIGNGAPIYAVDSIINNANMNSSRTGATQTGTSEIPSGSGTPFLTPPASPQTAPSQGPETAPDGPMPFTLQNNKLNGLPVNYSGIIIRGQAPLTPPGAQIGGAPALAPPGSAVQAGTNTPNQSPATTTVPATPPASAQETTSQPVFPPEKQRVINELVRVLFPVKAEESGAGDSPILEIPLTLHKAIERAQGNSAARVRIVEVYWKLRSKISELEVEKAIRQSCQLVYSSFEKEMGRGAGASNPELTALVGSFKAAISAADARIYQAQINIRYSQIDLMEKMGQTTDTGWPVPSSYPYCGPSYRLEIDKARRNNFTLATESVLIPEKLKTIQMIGMALGPVAELFRPNISSLRTTNDGYLYLKTLENKRDSALLFIQLVESLNTSIVHYVADFTDMPISNEDFIQSLVGPEK